MKADLQTERIPQVGELIRDPIRCGDLRDDEVIRFTTSEHGNHLGGEWDIPHTIVSFWHFLVYPFTIGTANHIRVNMENVSVKIAISKGGNFTTAE